MSRTNYLGLAYRFNRDRFGTPSRLRYHKETWWGWSLGRYYVVTESDLRGNIKRWLKEESEPCRNCDCTEMLSAVAALQEVNIPDFVPMPCFMEAGEYDDTCNWLACKNTILDLDNVVKDNCTRNLTNPTPNWFSPVVLDFDFDPGAGCPLFETFLRRSIPDVKTRDLTQEWFGYCLTKDTDLRSMLVLYGEGRTGKSTLTNVLEALVGAENRSAVALEDMGGKYAAYLTIGKLVNFCGDAKGIKNLAEGVIKSFTGGDSMTVDEKYKRIYVAKMTAKIMACTNVFPKIHDVSDAMWTRFLVVPMNEVIPKGDVDLKLLHSEHLDWPLRNELPGILNWALAGLKRLRQQGRFTEAESMTTAKATLRHENCSLTQFVEERCTANDAWEEPCKRFMMEYQAFCGQQCIYPLSGPEVGKVLRRLLPGVKKRKLGPRGEQQACYIGVQIHVPRD